MDLGPVLQSELGEKWRYGALKACIGYNWSQAKIIQGLKGFIKGLKPFKP